MVVSSIWLLVAVCLFVVVRQMFSYPLTSVAFQSWSHMARLRDLGDLTLRS
jgi:hypothetical protein